MRIGPGPVFVYESLIFARRRQVYAGRALFVLALLIGLATGWWSLGDEATDGSLTTAGRLALPGMAMGVRMAVGDTGALPSGP